MGDKVLFRKTTSFSFKIPFHNLNFGTSGYASKSLVSFGILNIRCNEKVIQVSQLNSNTLTALSKSEAKSKMPQLS